MNNIIELKNVVKRVVSGPETISILEKVNLTVHKGEFVCISGKSGSGKTTLLNIISLIDSPTSGQVLFEDNVMDGSQYENCKIRRENMGYIFQSYHLLPHLTVFQNLELVQSLKGETNSEEIYKRLEIVGLRNKADNYPSDLSGGEQQRVAIARSLINNPQLILCDEPTGNLDEENSNKILDIIIKLHSEGIAVVLVTHNPEFRIYADTIYDVENKNLVRI